MPSTDLVLSAHIAGNAEVFAQLMKLHVPRGATVADVTYGAGVFWSKIDKSAYILTSSDIETGTDCRLLPYSDSTYDAVVLDPPYMEGLLRKVPTHRGGRGTHVPFRSYYSGLAAHVGPQTGHGAVRQLYQTASAEAFRVLKPGGILVVKCQDEVSANKQWLTHVEVINDCALLGFYAKDVFVVMRRNRPGVSRIKKQVHARKNHSYFVVFQKLARRCSALRRTSSSEAIRSPTPPPVPGEIKPVVQPPVEVVAVAPISTPLPMARPSFLSRPSMSMFVTSLSVPEAGHRYAVHGNCKACMGQARDVYDKMHAAHVKAEAEASGR